MMKKLLKMTEIAMLRKNPLFSNYQRYRFQISIAKIEELNKDCVKFQVSILYTFREIRFQRALRSGETA